ncbi:N-acetylmuramic acid 6-phosphate etherase [Arthrobacter sp. B2a2-09]|uniref:N-acetylmuramic acid 6-phosphate etherase n=1 Tax=Arthrobacter sp. B2a2-09 TaxID=2952822 RepID=UPI0022CD75BE|nr:N-acetylmuramic acid 6-phosphate etherase [Arthrobacter sp. B2a2-09]MCZ9883618.1 N-acetylmuramic acid 6-phosphate etherase [Arthrobacter sp. B2a2-09]
METQPHAGQNGSAWLEISTEVRNANTLDLDQRTTIEILEALNDEDQQAPQAVRAILPQMAELVEAAAASVRNGGRVHYFGAGTSGRLGVLDAAELRPTFNLPDGVVIAHHAGGPAALTQAVENVEDCREAGAQAAADVRSGDIVIGIAASGRTPYVGGALTAGRELGATTALIACAREPELGPLADFVLAADTGPEALAGSTRLKAGTAQKLMLNGFSTALMIRLGRTWSNLMVSMVATNEKLRARTVRILMEATGAAEESCRGALQSADGDLKVALVIMLSGASPANARDAVEVAGGNVRDAASALANE